MPVAAHRVHLSQLQARERLHIQGEVAQREAPQGLYEDGWSDGDLAFTIEPARDLTGFTTRGIVPDWWPEGSVVSIEIDGERKCEVPAVPGRLDIRCDVALRHGQRARIGVRTSTSVHDPGQNRHLGVYIGQIEFRGSAALPQFRCNICSAANNRYDPVLDPEGSICRGCGSNIRQRGVARLVGDALFGKTLNVAEFPSSDARGIGISDSPRFASQLSRALPNYRNAQFDRSLVSAWAPYADVKNPQADLLGTADFVTCSDVLEHVEPPVGPAFSGLFSLLRPGGTLILTVPYTLGESVEHFPDLNVWHLEQRQGKRVLVNRTASGDVQRFDDLRFHGGGADVLEMRVFGLQDLFTYLEDAGFTDIRVRDENTIEQGVFYRYNWGLPVTAKRP